MQNNTEGSFWGPEWDDETKHKNTVYIYTAPTHWKVKDVPTVDDVHPKDIRKKMVCGHFVDESKCTDCGECIACGDCTYCETCDSHTCDHDNH